MENCLFRGEGGVIKVVKSNSGIMEFSGRITTGCIANQFPRHAIFPSHDLFWLQLNADDFLLPGSSYYLLPLNNDNTKIGEQVVVREGHVRSKSIPVVTPYRISFDYGMLKRSYAEAFSSCRYSTSHGFWKVKLVSTPRELLEILSQKAQTQDFIETMRAVANCRNGSVTSSSSSDQWSLCSSRNGSSKKDVLLDI